MELVVSMAQIFPTVYKQVSITDHADDIAKKSKYLPWQVQMKYAIIDDKSLNNKWMAKCVCK